MSDLEQRLRAVESSSNREMAGITTNWYRNPDGPEAADRLRQYREALEDIVSPLAALRRHAEERGERLSSLASQIANDPGYLQSLARTALKETTDVD